MIKINRQKPYDNYYHVYVNGKKIKNKSKGFLSRGDMVDIIESNVLYSKFCYFYAFFNMIIALFSGSFDDYKESKLTQIRVKIKILEVNSENVTFNIPQDINQLSIDGVTLFEKISCEQVSDEKIIKRLAILKKSLVFVPILILSIVLIVLTVVLLK